MKLYIIVNKEALTEFVRSGAMIKPLSIVVMSLSSPEEAVCDVWRPGCDLNKEYNLYEVDLKDGIVVPAVKQIPVPIIKFEQGKRTA